MYNCSYFPLSEYDLLLLVAVSYKRLEMASGEEIDSDWSMGSSSPRKALEKLPKTAHDWEDELKYQKDLRKSAVYDDGTMTFFWLVFTCRSISANTLILINKLNKHLLHYISLQESTYCSYSACLLFIHDLCCCI